MNVDPSPPDGLGDAGRELWDAIIADVSPGWRLDARELHLLHEACLLADQIAALDAVVSVDGPMAKGAAGQPVVHPAVVEGRQLRIAQQRLLKAITLEDPVAVTARMNPSQKRAAHAADVRWTRARALGQV